ncbi:MAG: DUF4129 domain-containing protein [Spirochaetaceae bacterium]|nr:MAG: DUF4129 domain-containing protein [Spirochaetaceae bacterium]
MSVSVSVTAVLASLWLASAIVGLASPGVGVVAVVLLAALVEATVGNLLYRERAGIANRVRELIIYLLVVYLVASLWRPGPLSGRFEPALAQIVPVAAAGFAWLIAFVFHNRLRGREALLRAFHAKYDDELRHAVLDRQHDMTLTVAELRQARKLIGGFFFVLCLLAVLGSFDFMPDQVPATAAGAFVLLVLYGVTAIATMGALNIFMEEYAANGEGIAVPVRFGRRRAILVTVLIVGVFALAFALSRTQSLLPLDAIARFFEWLSSLFTREGAEREAVDLPRFEAPGLNPALAELIAQSEEYQPPLWLRLLVRLVQRLFVAALIVGAIVLVFGPLFSPAFRDALRRFRPGDFLRDLLSRWRLRWRVLKRLLRIGRRRSRADDAERTDTDRPVGRDALWKPSLRKRRQMDRVVAVFVSVTAWGARHGLPYRRSEAAHDYLGRIAALYPQTYPDARTVADIFCEARFSRQIVSFAQMREYAQAAKRIVRVS